jgi:hypothetical protein
MNLQTPIGRIRIVLWAFDDSLNPSSTCPWYQTGQLGLMSDGADQIVSFS